MKNTIKNTEHLREVISKITFKNTVLDFKWRFDFREVVFSGDGKTIDEGWLVWVTFERPDTTTGVVGRGRGRDEIIWAGSSVSSVVKTCWLLVELMIRHELMEGFRYNDCRIFNPHHTVGELASLELFHKVEES